MIYITALLLTYVIEGCVVFLCGFRKKSFFVSIIAINSITHPLLWTGALLLRQSFFRPYFELVVFLLEIAVIFVEFTLLHLIFRDTYSFRKLLILAAVMNGISYGVGRILQFVGIL